MKKLFILTIAIAMVSLCIAACAPETPPTPAVTEYTLSFNVNGGSPEISSQKYKEGDKLSLPTPTRKDFKFLGWQDETGTTYTADSTMPNRDLRLTAKWERIIYVASPDGEHIYFGDYPQTLVESDLAASLTSKAGSLPTAESAGVWNDYGYYASGKLESYMWYTDLTMDGERYRGVYFSQYRSADINREPVAENSYQDDNGFETGKVYWFKYEPLLWRILSSDGGYATLMSERVLDAQEFNSIPHGKNISANNYKESSLRAWLNGTFYDLAFDDFDRTIIQKTTVNNGPSSTIMEENEFLCEDTEDYVWILSNADSINPDYGFSEDEELYDTARRVKPTDYGKCQGVYTDVDDDEYAGYAVWWLRTPDWYMSDCAFCVNTGGHASGRGPVMYIHYGIVPVIKIKL